MTHPMDSVPMTELIDNPPPLPNHKHSLNSGSFAPLYTAAQYRAGEAAAFARGVAAGRNAWLEEAAKQCDKTTSADRCKRAILELRK